MLSAQTADGGMSVQVRQEEDNRKSEVHFYLKSSCFRLCTEMSDFDLKTTKFVSLFERFIFTEKVGLDEF